MKRLLLDRFGRIVVCVTLLLMNRLPVRNLARLAAFSFVMILTACTDSPVNPGFTPPPELYGSVSPEYECHVDVRVGTMECGPAYAEGGGPRLDLLLYGAHAKAVVIGGPAYSNGDNTNQDTLTYSLAVLNLMPQAIGTTDGVTAAPAGTRLVITSYVQSGAGATLDNADGTATFIDSASAGGPYTFPNKQYISYPGVLSPGDTSQAKTLRLVYNPVVSTINFKYRISAVVQYPHGWITISPSTVPVLAPGQTASLTGTVYDAFGTVLFEGITWLDSNPGVVSIHPVTGQVTAIHEGTTTIRATSTTNANRTGTRVIVVDEAPAVTSTSPVHGGQILLWDPIVIEFTELVNVTSNSFTLECPTGSSQAFTVSGSGTNTITLDPVSDLPVGTTCTVTVIGAQVSDADVLDGPDQMAGNYVFSLDVIGFP